MRIDRGSERKRDKDREPAVHAPRVEVEGHAADGSHSVEHEEAVVLAANVRDAAHRLPSPRRRLRCVGGTFRINGANGGEGRRISHSAGWRFDVGNAP